MVGAQNIKKYKDWLVVSLAVFIPVAAALGGSYLLGSEAFHSQDAQNLQTKMEEVRSQSRLLLENVWDQIDSLRIKAIDFDRTHAALDPEIKAYADITFNPNGTPHGLKNLTQNSAWTNAPATFASLADAAVREVSSKRIRDAGGESRSNSKGARQGTEYVGIAFQSGTRSIFVTVDPTEVFSRFPRWATGAKQANCAGYLIGADGKVIVHSERVYTGADFSGSDVFVQALRPLFRDERLSGVATYRAVDLRNVTTAYIRLANLPFAVVVERVAHPAGVGWIRPILIPAILLLTASLLICLFSILAIQKYFDLEARTEVRVVAAIDQMTANAVNRMTEARDLNGFKNRLRETVEDRLGDTAVDFQTFVEESQNPPLRRTLRPPRCPITVLNVFRLSSVPRLF